MKEMMTRLILTAALLVGVTLNTLAQEIVEVSGTVIDVNKEPLIGVSVFVTDAPGLGTVTDNDGNYSIRVERYKKLTFSYIGYDKKEILIKDDFVIDVTLEESEMSVLDEVIVTGTGPQTRLTMTGAVSTPDLNDMKSNPTSSLSNALAGNVPGVLAMMQSGQPGKNISEFWIRGISTFGGGTGALVLVDNIERDLNEINIEDIETFTVLKDAAV